jgi:hypothetical protein
VSNLLIMSPADFCAATKACREGRNWALTQPTIADVWENCQRPDWLLWILDAIDQRPDDRTMRLFAIWCARNTPLSDGRVTGDLLTDPRSLAALKVAAQFAHGRATSEELSAAWAAAWAAEVAAWDAARAAGAAAGAAARGAAGDAAWDAAWVAWDATAEAAARDAAGDAAGAAEAAREAQADHLRTLVPNPFKREVNK